MNLKKEFWILPFIILVGNLVLFSFFFISPATYEYVIVLKNAESSFAPIRFFVMVPMLVIGLAILSYITIIYIIRYKKDPNDTRQIVLTALIYLTISLGIFFFDTVFRFTEKIVKEFIRTLNIYLLFFSIYFLILFGIDILISLEDERLKRRLKVVLNIMGFVNFSFYFIGEVLRIYNHEEDGGIIIAISDYSMYFIVLISVVLLIIMSSRSFTIQRRTNDETYKSGLRSLSFSFLLIAIAIIIGFSGQIIDLDLFSDITNVITVFLAISGFWFIYLGFVKPARNQKE